MNISVTMATYNGEKYISEQIESILKQLDENDELIISDDHSRDKTIDIIKSYMENDSRIKLFFNNKKGVISNFENAIRVSINEIIFLSDQDDVWLDNKVETIKRYFSNENLILVISDVYIVDSNLNMFQESFFKKMHSGRGVLKNIINNTYMGCAIAFKSELKEKILPIPAKVPMHDMWIGILAEYCGNVKFIPEKLIYYRRHASVATSYHASLIQKLKWRKNLIAELYKWKRNNK